MGQDCRRFRVVALEGGRGGRGHRACLPNSVTQFEGFGVEWGWGWGEETAGGAGETGMKGGEGETGGPQEKVVL